MTNQPDPIERFTERFQDFAIAHAPIAGLFAVAVALYLIGVLFTFFAPLGGLPGRLLIFGPIAIGSAALGLARWVRSERRYIAQHHDAG